MPPYLRQRPDIHAQEIFPLALSHPPGMVRGFWMVALQIFLCKQMHGSSELWWGRNLCLIIDKEHWEILNSAGGKDNNILGLIHSSLSTYP